MINCLICNKEFKMITNSHLKKAHNMTTEDYMSSSEGAAFCDEEMLAKIVETRHGVVRPECKHPECEKTVTQSWNTFCSYSCSNSFNQSKKYGNNQAGSKNSQYTDGTYTLEKSKKLEARKRDNYKCQTCGKAVKGRAAHVHHIVAERCFDDMERAHDLSNLVTVCSSCHVDVEWGTLKELHKRAAAFDEIMKDDPNFESFEQYKSNLFPLLKGKQ